MKIRNLLWIGLLVILLSACGGAQETILTGDEKDAVLEFSEPMTDNLLAGMNANDYATFSMDFDEQMLAAMTEANFAEFKKDRDSKLGAYVSRQVDSVRQSGDFYAVIYKTEFEKDDNVSMRVVFRLADPHNISGLWFDK